MGLKVNSPWVLKFYIQKNKITSIFMIPAKLLESMIIQQYYSGCDGDSSIS